MFGRVPGVYPRENDRSFGVPAPATAIGAVVIHSDKGATDEIKLITSRRQFIEEYGEPKPTRPSMYPALAFLDRSSQLRVKRVINDATVAEVDVPDDASGSFSFLVKAKNAGAWGNNIGIQTQSTELSFNRFNIDVLYNGDVVESFTVSKDELAKDGFGRSLYIEDVINETSNFINVVDDTTNSAEPTHDTVYDLIGGSDDTAPPSAADIGTAWGEFKNKNKYDITLLINAGWASTDAQTAIVDVAETRKDCIAILDVPENDSTGSDIANYSNSTLNLNTSWASLYGGWVQIADSYNDKRIYVAPSGHVAGVYAHTANVAEPWIAPAGPRRGTLNVLGTKHIFDDGELAEIHDAKVNPIVEVAGQGIQVGGQHTQQREPSALDRVNVRMLVITIQKALKASLRNFVFEQNDEFTRSNIESLINGYMEDVQSRRGVTEFRAVVDESNNTAQVIDANQLVADLFIKPTRTAEFIRLNVVITSTGADLSAE